MPPGFWECGDHDKQAEMIKKNMRAILQLFGIRVLVYPDCVEIKGTIPPQVLYQGEEPEPETGLVITSPSLYKGGGTCFLREASSLFDSPYSRVTIKGSLEG